LDPDDEALAAKQRASAEDMVRCLKDKGVDSELAAGGPIGYGEAEFRMIWPIIESEGSAFNMPGTGGMGDPEIVEKLGLDGDKPYLYTAGQDLTAELVACIDETGYFMPEPKFDPREEEADKQLIADASNTWAVCARQNGLPDVKDAKVEADNWATVPSALVSGSVTVDELKAVLVQCPPFDPDRDLAAPQDVDGTGPRLTDPSIGFDLPEGDPKLEQLKTTLQDHTMDELEKARS
jgi:hypothetical protein